MCKLKSEKYPNTDFLLVPNILIFRLSAEIYRIDLHLRTDQKNHRYGNFCRSGAQCMISVVYERISKIYETKKKLF